MTEHFIIVGAQRCGTTKVYRLLEQHPDICMATPMRPEPKFFLNNENLDAGYAGYLRQYFGHRKDERLLGEKSTSYIEREDAAARIHDMLPNAKLIFVLRDPATRAYSNWCFSRDNGLEGLDFESALDAESDRIRQWNSTSISVNPFAYTARGHYVRYLDRWARYFNRDQFILVVSERLFTSLDHMRDIFTRLGVRNDIELADGGRINASTGASPPLRADCRKRLCTLFAESNQALHDRWGIDTSGWL